MYFNEKEDTNIDKELKPKKKFALSRKAIIIIGVILMIVITISVIILLLNIIPRYHLNLNGDSIITIYEGTTYIEPGYDAFDNKKNNLTNEVTIEDNLDVNKIGTYTITYKLHSKTKTRTINVVAKPSIITIIHLNGDKNLYINVGTSYEEPGYSAIDAIDGDLTGKVSVNSNVDTSKRGSYRIIYSVINSDGITTSEVRTVIVQ